jgi:hypothetical protein
MQATWKHRGALGRRSVTGPGGATTRLGRLGLPYLLTFTVVLPVLAPLVDLLALVDVLLTGAVHALLLWGLFASIQCAIAAYALHLDGERKRTLWALPLQQIVYRQLMYLVVVEATIAALTGRRLRWHKVARHGTAGQQLKHGTVLQAEPVDLARPAAGPPERLPTAASAPGRQPGILTVAGTLRGQDAAHPWRSSHPSASGNAPQDADRGQARHHLSGPVAGRASGH